MYTLKTIFKRGSLFGATLAMVAATVAPSAAVFADTLNPLTDRSLLLSSSAPGFQDTDGSGYSTGVPNPAAPGVAPTVIPGTYAPAGTGPNGKKSGQTFRFKTSSTGVIKGFTFQYCTTAAGLCRGPGTNAGDADPNKDGNLVDSTRELNETTGEGWDKKTSDFNATAGFTQGTGAGQFQIFVGPGSGTPLDPSDWTYVTGNKENATHSQPKTGKNNYITLHNSAAATSIAGGTQIRIVFTPSESVFLTNPGANEFFVKLNTYDTHELTDHVPGNVHNIDGGVTVANVMTDSIHITTKVLETMSFSVGTRNRDTLANSTMNCGATWDLPANDPIRIAAVEGGCEANTGAAHAPCVPVQQVDSNRLNLGDPDAEYSLQTTKAWSVYSFWRLSSNSSGGATVYYSGDTLSNTVGDQIADMPGDVNGDPVNSTPGSEQFGLGFVAPEAPHADYVATFPGREVDSFPFRTLASGQDTVSTKWDPATLPSQTYTLKYGMAQGTNIGGTDSTSHVSSDAAFKFLKTSTTSPEPIAQQNNQVISCATAKMRYVGNIAADTPAGVYTTKINYLAAPQY